VTALPRLWRTLRYLKPVQICNRIQRRLFRPGIDGRSAPQLRPQAATALPFYIREPSWFGDDEFRFLNETHHVRGADGWDRPEIARLWRYHLHYFDDLSRLEASHMRQNHTRLIRRWIDENPAGHGTGWEAYPTSLRIVNWIKWQLLGGSLDDTALNNLACQTRYLNRSLEYHLLGNHLWSNAKALIFAGLFYRGTEADGWLDRGLSLFAEQCAEQILPDGGHFERSPAYHALATEDVLDLLNLFAVYARDRDTSLEIAAERMLRWLAIMSDGSGQYLSWNDAASGWAPTIVGLTAYAQLLAIPFARMKDNPGMTVLSDTGYFRFDSPNYTLWADAAPIGPDYIPGHAHADALHFELHVNGQPLIVDTGTSTYARGRERTYERGTMAHNTVVLGGLDQSEMWDAFRIGRRSRIENLVWGNDWLRAAHTGYDWLGARHQRTFRFADNSVNILDRIFGETHRLAAIARFHLKPGVAITIRESGFEADGARFTFSGAAAIKQIDCEISDGFNLRAKSLSIEVEFRDCLTTAILLQ
jgi:uncharacterized heparinase superfamily protein